MPVNSVRVGFETLRALPYSSISSSYTIVDGTTGTFTHTIRLLKIANTTNANLIISYINAKDQDFIAANSFILYDFSSDKTITGGTFEQAMGDGVYVKLETGATATSGNVYVTACYGR